MKAIHVLHLCRVFSETGFTRNISTGSALLVRGKVPRKINYEPGVRHREAGLEVDQTTEEIDQEELEGELDVMNLENVYDLKESETKKHKSKVNYLITAQKFFSPPPQPLMLTCNERECIRYLHKQDPVQWNIKTLSESFPATPDTIKKIIKTKWKITPERAKILDTKAQRNWELLAEGKLQAEPYVIEHMKKFINRREVLLEQIKNSDFYLPEVKKERVWNNGEFSKILTKYEKRIEHLLKATDKPKMIEDKTKEKTQEEKDEKNYLDTLHKKIENTGAKLENKDTFMFGGVTSFYSKMTTLDKLEDDILKKTEARKRLDLYDKAIIENKLDNYKDSTINSKSEPFDTKETSEEKFVSKTKNNTKRRIKNEMELSQDEETHFGNEYNVNNTKETSKVFSKAKNNMKINEMEVQENEVALPDERTHFGKEFEVGKLLRDIQNPPEKKNKSRFEPEVLDSFALERENIYYNKEVKDLEETAFWNTQRTSKEKAAMELQKPQLSEPVNHGRGINVAKTFPLSTDSYPERISIPKNKWKRGLTFRVKDCFYDDDGEFLYRVPGMIK